MQKVTNMGVTIHKASHAVSNHLELDQYGCHYIHKGSHAVSNHLELDQYGCHYIHNWSQAC